MKNRILLLLFIVASSSQMYAQMLDELTGKFADGVTIQKVLKKELSEPDFYFRDTLKLTSGRFVEVNSGFSNCCKSSPQRATKEEARYIFALDYYTHGKYDEAWTEADKISKERKNRFTRLEYILKSKILIAQGKEPEAIELLNEAIEKCGESFPLYYNLGLTNYKAGKIEAAQTSIQKAISIDVTFPDALLLYAAMLNEEGRWVESFFAYHFFLLLEPNTIRSKIAFQELYSILNKPDDPRAMQLAEYDLDKHDIREYLFGLANEYDKKGSEFKFFESASVYIFNLLTKEAKEEYPGLLWDFFVPIYYEIMYSGSAQTYLRYVSSSYLAESFDWWTKNPERVDRFISWFENGDSGAGNDEIRKTQN